MDEHIAHYSTLAAVSDLLGQIPEGDPLYHRFCTFTHQIRTVTGDPLQDKDILVAAYHLERRYNWAKSPPSTRVVYDAIQLAAWERRYHPVKEYLAGLKWDGEARASRLFSRYLGSADSLLRRAQSRAFLVGAVARIMSPGCKLDTMPVLVAPQGFGKSTAIKLLAVQDDWFQDTPMDLRSKDCYEVIQGAWMVEIAEMESIMSSSPKQVKAFLSSQVDTFRPAYGRCKVHRPRQGVMIGTSNDLQLADTTGNRRYWPIVLEHRPDWKGIEEDRDQLWGEAVALWTAGQAWHLTGDSITKEAEEEVKAFSTVDPWEEQIRAFWYYGGWNGTDTHPKSTEFQASDVLCYMGVKVSDQRQAQVMRLTRLLRGLGFKSHRARAGGSRRRLWTLTTGPAGPAFSKTLAVPCQVSNNTPGPDHPAQEERDDDNARN